MIIRRAVLLLVLVLFASVTIGVIVGLDSSARSAIVGQLVRSPSAIPPEPAEDEPSPPKKVATPRPRASTPSATPTPTATPTPEATDWPQGLLKLLGREELCGQYNKFREDRALRNDQLRARRHTAEAHPAPAPQNGAAPAANGHPRPAHAP